tara:strand:- start:2337 stop:2666 length:330 start_codon:yes stop_codon:yes gene_type:complete
MEEIFKKIIHHLNKGEEVEFYSGLSGMGLEFSFNKCPLDDNDRSKLYSWIYEEVGTQSCYTDNCGCSGAFKFETSKLNGTDELTLECDLTIYDVDGEIESEEVEYIDVY